MEKQDNNSKSMLVIRIPSDLKREMKMLAIKSGRTLTEECVEILKRSVQHRTATTKQAKQQVKEPRKRVAIQKKAEAKKPVKSRVRMMLHGGKEIAEDILRDLVGMNHNHNNPIHAEN